MDTFMQLKRRYAFPIWVRFSGDFLTGLTNGMLAPYLILYINSRLGGQLLSSMLIVGLGPLTEILFTLFGGRLTDRIGRKSAITFSLFSQSLVMVGFSSAHTLWLFAFLYIANGLCRSLYIPAARAQIVDVTDEHLRSEVFAVLSTVGSIGFSIGPVLGLWVYAHHPGLVFIFEAGALFLYASIYSACIKETAPIQADNTPVSHKNKRMARRERTFFFFQYRGILLLMVFMLPISFFHAQTETNYRIYLEHVFPNYLSVLAILSTVQAIMMLTLEILLVKWSDSFKITHIVLLSYGSYFIVSILYGFSTTLSSLLIAQFFLTVGQTIGINHMHRFVSKLAPANERGIYFALFGTHWDLSRMIGPFVGSLILLHFGGAVLFSIVGVLIIAGGMGQYHVVRKVGP